jgi:hypothetical protein
MAERVAEIALVGPAPPYGSIAPGERLTDRERIHRVGTDVPGADLCPNAHPDHSALRTSPTPGNRRAQPLKAGLRH